MGISRSITAEMNLIVVASLLFGAITSIESACPSAPGWMPGHFYDTCYLLSPNPMTYLQAQQFCVGKGGYLAEIKSEEEQNSLNAFLSWDDCYWIGLSYAHVEGKWIWQHSFSPLGDYTNWHSGEPNGAEKEDCVIQLNGGGDWGWHDVACEVYEKTHALCQYKY